MKIWTKNEWERNRTIIGSVYTRGLLLSLQQNKKKENNLRNLIEIKKI